MRNETVKDGIWVLRVVFDKQIKTSLIRSLGGATPGGKREASGLAQPDLKRRIATCPR